MPGSMVDPQLNQSTDSGTGSASDSKAIVVGLYGVPGSGKTFLLDQLKQELGQEHFAFYEGSKMIATVVPGGLDAFQKLEEQEKARWRQLAIDTIGKKCAESGQVAVVAGHFIFWPEEEEAGRPVYTQNDLDTFTHILYLDVPAEIVAQRRLDDTERSRPSISVTHLRKWQQAEKTHLRQKYNLSHAESRLEEVLAARQGQLEVVLVIDADRTLAAEDTGTLFWKRVSNSRQSMDEECPLKTLFSSPLGYSYTAFRQAALLYEEAANDQEYDALCQDVSSAVAMHPEFVSLLQLVAEQEHVGAVVVTCGLRRVWEKVLKREGLSNMVKVIGGGRISDGYVVTGTVKAALVARLRDTHKMYVWAFGDSPLDLDMLSKADQAIVVVGEKQTRSKTMDTALMNAIDNKGLQARQVVLPSNASPRLDTTKLPLIQLTGNEFINSVLCHCNRLTGLQVLLATGRNAAKLLATPMRDAAVSGSMLREAHRRVGCYLAIEFLTSVIGVEECQISHVLGHDTSGYRLLHEQQTTIVALMRAGEPMAFGVSDAFSLAMFVHASRPDDIKLHHLQGQVTVVLVDSVVNSGKTVVEFVQAVRNLHATIRIVVVAGVVQAQCVSQGSLINQALAGYGNLSLVALRLSDVATRKRLRQRKVG
ncbi:MAG: hypothetical protein M1816_002773 [Peltula sp. TS41687]|nr:MAG: hypothetical protein M1816_002773 [Peltula sp. TS41687]